MKQLADELHGEILERQCRAVEKLQQEMIGADLHQRRAGGVAETAVGARDDALQFGIRETLANEGPHDAKCDIFIGQPGEGGDIGCAHRRDGFGQIQPAVAGEPGQHGLFKAQYRGLPASGMIAHRISFNRLIA